MRVIIYQFEVRENEDSNFISAWKELTELIFKHEGSLGSRLPKTDDNTYIAYAQWPDALTYENAGSNLPESANAIRQKMRNACESIKTLYELDVVEDLLR